MKEIPEVQLNNWHEVPGSNALIGEVYGHPRYRDGEQVRTSPILERGDGYVITAQTKYILGNSLVMQ